MEMLRTEYKLLVMNHIGLVEISENHNQHPAHKRFAQVFKSRTVRRGQSSNPLFFLD